MENKPFVPISMESIRKYQEAFRGVKVDPPKPKPKKIEEEAIEELNVVLPSLDLLISFLNEL